MADPPASNSRPGAAEARWVGPLTREDSTGVFYAAADVGGTQYALGDAVYVLPADEGVEPFVGKLELLVESRGCGHKRAGIQWFYRPSELAEALDVPAVASELFISDDFDVVPLRSVCGKCTVLTPAQADRRPGSSFEHPAPANTFTCSQRYISGERRVVPADDAIAGVSLDTVLQQKPYTLDADGRAVQAEPTAADKAAEQPRSKRVAGVQEGEAGPAAPAEAAAEGEQERAAPADLQAELQAELPHQPPPKKRKHEREREERESGTEGEGAPPMAAAHAGAPRASSLAGSGED